MNGYLEILMMRIKKMRKIIIKANSTNTSLSSRNPTSTQHVMIVFLPQNLQKNIHVIYNNSVNLATSII